MGKFVLKRLLLALLSLFLITTLAFLIISLKPGDPIAAKSNQMPERTREILRAKYGLDQPMYVRYFSYLKTLLTTGNLGDSVVYDGKNVNQIIGKEAIVSAKIGLIAIALMTVFGVTIGLLCGLKRGSFGDHLTRVLVVLLICIPSFVFCALLQYLVAFKWKICPLFGWGELKHYTLPVLAYGLGGIATYSKFMRTSTIEVLNEDYIQTAVAKGVGRTRLIFKHVFRNAIMPIITMLPVAIGGIFGGAMIIENFFSIPGMGSRYVKATTDSDPLMILGMTVFFGFIYIISLFVVDILYGIVDPRIRITDY